MKKILCSIAVMIAAATPMAHAIKLDTGNPEKPFAVGIRIGANCSNLSTNYSTSMRNIESFDSRWGAGFDLGVVFDLNIKKYLVLQPGFFFQTRSNDYQMVIIDRDEPRMENRNGGYTSTYFKIPLVMSFRLDISDQIQWQADFGPYFQFGLGGRDKMDIYSLSGNPLNSNNVIDNQYKRDYFGNDGFVRDYDWGFKIGTGLLYDEHYYLGIHYEAGCRNVLPPVEESRRDVNGHNKAWTFTVGYVF